MTSKEAFAVSTGINGALQTAANIARAAGLQAEEDIIRDALEQVRKMERAKLREIANNA